MKRPLQREKQIEYGSENMDDPLKPQIPQEFLNLLAGGISGMVAKSFVAPVDRIKILYQVTNVEFKLRNVPSVVNAIIQQEGISALWKGNTATMLRVFPYSGVQFMMYDVAKHFFSNDQKERGITPFENLCAGMFAGSISVLCTYPLDLTRAQLAVLVKGKNKAELERNSIKNVFLSNLKEKGFQGLYRGLSPTMIGILPYSGLAFTINEQSKERIINRKGREPTTVEKLLCGALSGAIAQTLTYPLEVIRRRMQTHGLITEKISDNILEPTIKHLEANKSSPPNTMIGIIKNLYKYEGIAGFFKGVSMNWLKGPIAFSISFTTYDFLKHKFRGTDSISPPPVSANIMNVIVSDDEGHRLLKREKS